MSTRKQALTQVSPKGERGRWDRLLSQSQEVLLWDDQMSHGFMSDK